MIEFCVPLMTSPLPAGSGKTLISVLLIRDKAHELQQAVKKVTIFLAPRVSLVNQVWHMRVIITAAI